jgi:glycosyltransferase involved in cell wall biosynthesis
MAMAGPSVLIVSHLFPRPGQLISGTFVLDQVKALRAQGVDARVLSGRFVIARRPRQWLVHRKAGPVISRTEWEGVPVYDVECPVWLPQVGYPYHYRSAVTAAALKLAREFPFEVIHAHTSLLDGFAAAEIGRSLRLPYIVTEHSTTIRAWRSNFVYRRILNQVVAGAALVFAVSEALRRTLCEGSRVEGQSRVSVLPNGVDLTLFSPAVEWAPNPEAPRIAFVGRLAPVKNVSGLLRAFSMLRADFSDARLRILGDGPQREELASLARELGIGDAVTFEGASPRQRVAEVLRHWADCLVLPSFVETFGCVVIESLACGKPVVATPSGGPEEILIGDELGKLVPIGDVQALAEGLKKVVMGLRESDPLRLRESVRSRFSVEAISEKLRQTYCGLSASESTSG